MIDMLADGGCWMFQQQMTATIHVVLVVALFASAATVKGQPGS